MWCGVEGCSSVPPWNILRRHRTRNVRRMSRGGVPRCDWVDGVQTMRIRVVLSCGRDGGASLQCWQPHERDEPDEPCRMHHDASWLFQPHRQRQADAVRCGDRRAQCAIWRLRGVRGRPLPKQHGLDCMSAVPRRVLLQGGRVCADAMSGRHCEVAGLSGRDDERGGLRRVYYWHILSGGEPSGDQLQRGYVQRPGDAGDVPQVCGGLVSGV